MQQLKMSTQYQEQKFFFEIKVAIAKVAPYAVFVGKRISGFRYAEEAEIFSRVAIDINQWLREVCTAKLLETQTILGGPGVVIQIAESFVQAQTQGRQETSAIIK